MRLILFVFSVLAALPNAYAKPIYIILDPAHGGPMEWGMASSGFDEKNVNLQLTKKIQKILEESGKFEIVLTRIGDYPVSMNDRRKIANQYESSVYISIHSSTYDSNGHIFTHVLKQVRSEKESNLTPIESAHGKESTNSMKLAQTLENEFPENIEHQILIAKYPLISLIGIQSPAVIVECQCVPQNTQNWSEDQLDEFARPIAEGIKTFAKREL